MVCTSSLSTQHMYGVYFKPFYTAYVWCVLQAFLHSICMVCSSSLSTQHMYGVYFKPFYTAYVWCVLQAFLHSICMVCSSSLSTQHMYGVYFNMVCISTHQRDEWYKCTLGLCTVERTHGLKLLNKVIGAYWSAQCSASVSWHVCACL